jgi:hypothetical protein
VPPIALRRGRALLVAHLIDPTRPFVKANAKRGLVAAGRPTDLDDASRSTTWAASNGRSATA